MARLKAFFLFFWQAGAKASRRAHLAVRFVRFYVYARVVLKSEPRHAFVLAYQMFHL